MGSKKEYRERMLNLHFYGEKKGKKDLLKELQEYWAKHDEEVIGLRDRNMRIFRNLLFEKESIKIKVKSQSGDPYIRDGIIWNEKKDADFAAAFFVIVLTMRNRRGWWDEKKLDYDSSIPSNLRTVLRHWRKQVDDILEPDALCQVIYQMNNINYLALAVANIERSRRLRVSEASTNINNAIVEQLINAADKYCKLVEDKGNLSPLYICKNEYLDVVIQLQKILSLLRTSNHKQTISDSAKLKDKLGALIKNNPKDYYLKILKWWTLYVMYRSYMSTNNYEKANEKNGPYGQMKDLEKHNPANDYSNYLKTLFTDNAEGKTTNSVLRKNLRILETYYGARVAELQLKRRTKNQALQKRKDPVKSFGIKGDWKEWKNDSQKHTASLYTVIYDGRKEDGQNRKFKKTPSRADAAYLHEKVERIKVQVASVYEAIEIICSRGHHLAPIQILLLLHDFMYRMEDEFQILSTRKKHKGNELEDIKEWLDDSCCNMLIGVLETFRREIIVDGSRFDLQNNELKQAITFWISELKRVGRVKQGESSEIMRIKNKCKGIADVFCTAVYGDREKDEKGKEGNYLEPTVLSLYYNKKGKGASKCFIIYKPMEKIAGEAPLKTLE